MLHISTIWRIESEELMVFLGCHPAKYKPLHCSTLIIIPRRIVMWTNLYVSEWHGFIHKRLHRCVITFRKTVGIARWICEHFRRSQIITETAKVEFPYGILRTYKRNDMHCRASGILCTFKCNEVAVPHWCAIEFNVSADRYLSTDFDKYWFVSSVKAIEGSYFISRNHINPSRSLPTNEVWNTQDVP